MQEDYVLLFSLSPHFEYFDAQFVSNLRPSNVDIEDRLYNLQTICKLEYLKRLSNLREKSNARDVSTNGSIWVQISLSVLVRLVEQQ